MADTTSALRVLETSQPPGFYLPPDDVDLTLLLPSASPIHDLRVEGGGRPTSTSWSATCRGRGRRRGRTRSRGRGYEALAGHLAFYAQKMDRCSVAGEVVQANEGDFYGGWVTTKVVGPFKGGPGTRGW